MRPFEECQVMDTLSLLVFCGLGQKIACAMR
jgi:hypothetical protein